MSVQKTWVGEELCDPLKPTPKLDELDIAWVLQIPNDPFLGEDEEQASEIAHKKETY